MPSLRPPTSWYDPPAKCATCHEQAEVVTCKAPGCTNEVCRCCRFFCPDCEQSFCAKHKDSCGCLDYRIAQAEEDEEDDAA